MLFDNTNESTQTYADPVDFGPAQETGNGKKIRNQKQGDDYSSPVRSSCYFVRLRLIFP